MSFGYQSHLPQWWMLVGSLGAIAAHLSWRITDGQGQIGGMLIAELGLIQMGGEKMPAP